VIDPDGFAVEADRLAAQLGVSVDLAGLERVQAALTARRTEALVVAAGCFAGEVVRRLVGGSWAADGTLTGVGRVAEASPLAKARAGEDLVTFVRRVVDIARDEPDVTTEKGL
jgi:hypothetical protein